MAIEIKNKVESYNSMATKNKVESLWIECSSGKKPWPKDERIWLRKPQTAYLYSKYKKKNRLTEKQEFIFYKNLTVLCSYVYFIVNDLQLPVPEHIHNFMLMKGMEEKDREAVKFYFRIIKN